MNIQARNAIIVLALVAIAATSVAQESQAPSATVNPAVLKVNDDLVYASDISLVMQNIAGQMGGRDKVQDQQQLVQMATQRVVEQKLLSQEALRVGIQPNDLRIAEMAQTIVKQAGGREALDASLAKMGSNYEQVIEMIREMDLVRSLIEQKISPSIQVSDEEVASFYAENQEMFKNEAQVHARHIITAADENADAATVAKASAKAEKARERRAHRRRSRFLHPRADGAGVCRCCLRPRARSNLGGGSLALRIPRHQGGGEAACGDTPPR